IGEGGVIGKIAEHAVDWRARGIVYDGKGRAGRERTTAKISERKMRTVNGYTVGHDLVGDNCAAVQLKVISRIGIQRERALDRQRLRYPSRSEAPTPIILTCR